MTVNRPCSRADEPFMCPLPACPLMRDTIAAPCELCPRDDTADDHNREVHGDG